METDTSPQLLQGIRDCGLYSPEQVAVAERVFASGLDDARLADKLQAAGVLTLYQARKIKAGRLVDILFGPFLILDKIGEGGMGKVFKAIQLRNGKAVALKVVRAQLSANSTVVSRYKREAKAAARLNHPNIVSLYDADEVNGRYYLAMEYVDGIDLSRMMKEFGKPPTTGLASYQEAAEYIRQVSLGLHNAHQYGLVHRDIKPSNLLVYGDRALPGMKGKTGVKILDMGLVRSLLDVEDTGNTELTRDGTVVGTPDYMAPEQAKNSKTVDHRADLYSLGCTLYYLLRGQSPFPDGSPIDKLLRHQLDPPPDLRRSRPDVPVGMIEIVEKLLRKNPDDRYQTAAEVAIAIAPFATGADLLEDIGPAPVVHEPFSFAADPGAVAHSPVTPAAALPAASTLAALDDIPEATIVGRPPPAGKVVRRAVPGAASGAKPDPQQNSGSVLAGRATRVSSRASGDTPASPIRRREKERSFTRKRNAPVVLVAVAVAVALIIVIVAAILAAGRRDPGTRPTSTAGTPVEGVAANRTSPDTPAVPSPVPATTAGPHELPPVGEWLPDRTSGVLVLHPQSYWKQLAANPKSGTRVTSYVEWLAEHTRFDPRQFERGIVAFVGRLGHPVAIGEGSFLTPAWEQELRSGKRVRIETQSGQNAYLFGTSWANSGPRAGIVLGDKAYAIGSDPRVLRDLASRVADRRLPEAVPAELLGSLSVTRDPDPPLVMFAAHGLWPMPDGTTLAEHRIRSVLATVRLANGQFEFDLILTGRYADRLKEFVNVHLTKSLVAQYPGLKPFAAALSAASLTTKQVGDEVELRLRGKMKWGDFQEAIEKLLPPVEKA